MWQNRIQDEWTKKMEELDLVGKLFGDGFGVIGATLAALAALAVVGLLLRLLSGQRSYPYAAQGELFTAAERAFLSELVKATAGRAEISGKVRVADVLRVEKGFMSQKQWWKAFTKISSKHVDFVLFEPGTARIIAAIELDDRSHDKRKRRKRDEFLDRAFDAAGVPLLRFRTARRYDRATIEAKLSPLLGDTPGLAA